MANAFNMLRPNDMIWSYVVNNYLKGIGADGLRPFDLEFTIRLACRAPIIRNICAIAIWRTNSPRAKWPWATRCLRSARSRSRLQSRGQGRHIAPARSVFNGAKLFGGEMRYVMGGSGHIAGVINPPGPKPKYQYWTGPAPSGRFEDWVAGAQEHPGSGAGLAGLDRGAGAEKVPAREPGGGKVETLGDAPGTYVRIKA